MKKKIGVLLLGVILIIIIIICFILQQKVKNDKDVLQQEMDKLNIMTTQTKSGMKLETEYIQVDDDQFYIKVPIDFDQLDRDAILQRYPKNTPGIVFSNEEGNVDIFIYMSDGIFENEEVKSYQKEIVQFLKQDNKLIDSTYDTIGKHAVAEVEFMSQEENQHFYNHTVFFSYDHKLVFISFRCFESLREEWETVGKFLIESLLFVEGE